MKKNNECGITLVTLCVYMIVLLVVLGILTAITNFYSRNMGILDNNTSYVVEFEKFNAYFTGDVKTNSTATISNEGKKIVFGDGTTYEYNSDEGRIYRNNERIASNVIAFNLSMETFSSGGINKNKINTKIYIGTETSISFKTSIGYILKYW